ncbi:MAG: NAD(P)H-hydrate dehydratase, partial [candidate division WOR-3 bacterium]|nr:NAD(P)H-hydrate dehydratase [candidate division WOR-3 bacterium]
LVTAGRMQELDRRAIAEHGIPGLALMENAGRAVVEFTEVHLSTEGQSPKGKVPSSTSASPLSTSPLEASRAESSLAGTRPLVICGKGNNGGDGFVVARLLLAKGAKPDCVLLGDSAKLSGDALANYQRLKDAGFPVREASARAEIETLFQNRKVIVDAIFGTGLTRAPAGLAAEVITLINQSGAYVVSVDLPSGLNSDTGVPYEPTVRADLTVTMAMPKLGLWLYPGRACAGTVEVADIGTVKGKGERGNDKVGLETFHSDLYPETFLLDADHVRAVLPRRRPDGHKGTFGTALIIAGSRGFSGAACLAGMAAVRSGCGLVHLAVPAGIIDAVASNVVEAVKTPLPQTENAALSPAALESILELSVESEAVALGPGIGTDRRTQNLELAFLAEVDRPTLIDADGVNNLVGHLALLARVKAPLLLTPHPGEFSRLTGLKPEEINADRIGVSRRFAAKHRVVLVLKGASTVVAAPDGRVFVNPTGNSGLASGGTGDVLTGLIVGLMAQGTSPLDAACAGVFLHGLAADIAVQSLTEYCLAAGDLPGYLCKAFAAVTRGDCTQGFPAGNPGTVPKTS